MLMCAVCVDIVKPPTPGLSRNKKKNKKKKQRGDSTSSDDGCSDQVHGVCVSFCIYKEGCIVYPHPHTHTHTHRLIIIITLNLPTHQYLP